MITGFIAGWCSGICSLLVGHPFSTIKVRQQVYPQGNIGAVVTSLFKAEGILGFYRGVTFPVTTAGITKSLYFGIYSNTLNIFQKKCVAEDQTTQRICAEKYPHHFREVFIAGCIAGVGHSWVACPIDLVKVRIQALQLQGSVVQGRIRSVVKDIYAYSGLRGFYRGLLVVMARDVPTGGVYVLLHEKFLSMGYDKETDSFSAKAKILSGGFAGAITWAAVVPIDVIKSRIQTDNLQAPKYTGYVDCVRKSYAEGGLLVFARGFWVSILRGFPVNVTAFFVYEFVFDHIHFHRNLLM